MTDEQILELVKFNLGISTTVRDRYLNNLIEGAKAELTEKGVTPDGQPDSYQKAYYYFIHDYVSWMYRNRGGEVALSPGLRFRLNNLIVGRKDV